MGRRNLQSLKSLVKHLIFIVLIVLGATGAWAQTPTRILDDIPVGWTVTADGVEVTVTPYYTGSPLGSAIIPEGVEVVLTPPDSVKPRVKDVELLLPEQIPLTFEAKMAGAVVSFGRYYPDSPQPATVTIEYSKNGGEWTTYTSSITLDYVGDKVYFRGNNTTYYLNMFYCSGDCYLYGNIMSLISSEDYATATALTESYAFAGLFSLNSDIYNHASKKLVLPATTLSSGCYSNMFNGCTGLTAAPELPANTMDEYCYYKMFEGCSGLTIAPELPAEILAEGCYSNMFSGCTSLTHAPALPVETLAEECYTGMFYGCTSLTSAPALPAMTMTPHCYQGMFDGCSSLTTAPALPATTLATQCYNGMFSNCTSLATAPALPATTLAGFCYDGMFSGDTSLTTAPVLPAETLSPNCYQYMFMGCKNLNSVTCLATNISATNCTTDWLDNVAATGTFIKPASMTDWLIDNPSGIPPGWTVISDGALPGEFTVNADGRKVNFSQGNLQYQASTNTWRFAEHQYDAVGSDNSNVSPSYSGWIDLFGWGTGNQPTQTSTDPNAYPPFVNWGTNAISNGGNTANSWYTLSESEWTYLISSRPNASSKRGQATVNGIHCYVLLPDEWTLPSGLSFTSDANNWTTNVYTAEQWAQMEAAGAVCFPTAGSRAGGANNTDINNFNNWGSYWSSTAANGTQGYNLWFTDNHVGTTDVGNYQMGTSVRLAKTLLKQDAEGYYLIGSVQDWRDFAALVQAIPTANAKMTADIAVVTTMIGTEEHPYQGTFDGDGHKLTVNISCTGTLFVAPFHRVFGGSVKNLYVDGIVSSNHNHMSGLIGRATGSVSIENCVVAVNIRMGSDYAAGFVGNGGSIQYQDESFVVMTDCLFMGTFTGVGAKRNKIAGFYGWGASTPAFINCLENGFFENTGTDHVPYLYEGTDENNPTSSSNSYYKHGSMSLSWATNASNMNNAELVAGLGNNWVTDPVIN